MTRRLCLVAVFSVYAALPLLSQEAGQSGKHDASSAAPQQSQAPGDESLPEEDESERPVEYTYNPLQAEHELKVGNFYFHKKNYNAALGRYSSATRWNPGWPEAYLRLGEAQAKLKNKDAARKAWAKVTELAPDSKEGHEAKKLASKL